MKKLIVTEESLEQAKRAGIKSFNQLGFTLEALFNAFDALFVPEDEVQSWKSDSECTYGERFVKGRYAVRRLGHLNYTPTWMLFDKSKDIKVAEINAKELSAFDYTAWADAEIALYEARQQPKPFGKGTRLRDANGDEFRVVAHYGEGHAIVKLEPVGATVIE